jgi:hypothetical protein
MNSIIETESTVKNFKTLPLHATYYTVIAGEIHECRKVNAKYGRKTQGRQGKVSHWLNGRVFDTAAAAQADLDALLERGRQIANRMQMVGGAA